MKLPYNRANCMYLIRSFYLICIIAALILSGFTPNNLSKSGNYPSEKISIEKYFPLDENMILHYESNFGPTNHTTKKSGGEYIQEYRSDEFFSKQKIRIENGSIFLTQMEQEIDVFLFVSHGIKVKYSEPALLLPLSLAINEKWTWEGIEYVGDKIDTIRISGELSGFEEISCKAGTFNCLRFDYEISKSSGKVTKYTEWREKEIGLIKLTADVSQKGFAGMMISLLGYDNIYFELSKIDIL